MESGHMFGLDRAKPAIFRSLSQGRDIVAKRQEDFSRQLRKKAVDFEERERALHQSFPPPVARIYRCKRFLLLQWVLKLLGWPDNQLVQHLVEGVRLLGELPVSGAFPCERTTPIQIVDELVRQANMAQCSALGDRPARG